MAGALHKIRVLDLTRILAGPLCTQILGDLGADIIKIEKPGAGDDTRQWGPPFLKDARGNDTSESAYYICCNRNKRSAAIDITSAGGQELIHRLLDECDVMVENFKTGTLKKYGLDYEEIHKRHPHIVYCSITGFGQTGPLAVEPGYDFLAQAMSGLMACTGNPGEEPMKTGVALGDVMTGLYAATGILAALRHRDETGEGQLIDLSLLDCTVAGMVNIAQYYLSAGTPPPRMGNAHPTIVPYQTFRTADGHIVIAVGNDAQFRRLAEFLGQDWADNEKFSANRLRVNNRTELISRMNPIIEKNTTEYWIKALQKIDVPAGPVNTIDQVFAMAQIKARQMEVEMPHEPTGQPLKMVGSPLKMSATPVSFRRAPPACGEHTEEILKEILGTKDIG